MQILDIRYTTTLKFLMKYIITCFKILQRSFLFLNKVILHIQLQLITTNKHESFPILKLFSIYVFIHEYETHCTKS